jgi:hypothetical protein
VKSPKYRTYSPRNGRNALDALSDNQLRYLAAFVAAWRVCGRDPLQSELESVGIDIGDIDGVRARLVVHGLAVSSYVNGRRAPRSLRPSARALQLLPAADAEKATAAE